MCPACKRLRKVDEEGAAVALILQRVFAHLDLVDLQGRDELELDAVAVREHLEADRVAAADELLLGIDAQIEVVEEQIVVGAIRPVRAA